MNHIKEIEIRIEPLHGILKIYIPNNQEWTINWPLSLDAYKMGPQWDGEISALIGKPNWIDPTSALQVKRTRDILTEIFKLANIKVNWK